MRCDWLWLYHVWEIAPGCLSGYSAIIANLILLIIGPNNYQPALQVPWSPYLCRVLLGLLVYCFWSSGPKNQLVSNKFPPFFGDKIIKTLCFNSCTSTALLPDISETGLYAISEWFWQMSLGISSCGSHLFVVSVQFVVLEHVAEDSWGRSGSF